MQIASSCGVGMSSVAFQASSILAKALLDRLRSNHTHILLSLDGFSTFLCQADPVWITFAQKMQSDSQDSAGETKLAGFIADELSSISTKWGFPVSGVFYKNGEEEDGKF
ncbi:hypothetical protein SprV_0501784300 [Sparganum proliferum]